MRKPVTFRFDPDLLERARKCANADNRSLTNYVETAVLRALELANGSSVGTVDEVQREGINK
jgi:predicted HicB family RNase H-like nuclease